MVSIAPEAEIFSVFRNLNYKPWYALAEYVDNSLQSYLDWRKQPNQSGRPEVLEVSISIEDREDLRRITIRDNARGIALEDFDRAFRVASRPRKDGKSFNEFGMGMKTASFWFADRWTVHTSVYGEAKERTMIFDLGQILDQRLLDIEPIEIPGSKNESFTVIELEELNQIPKGRALGKVKMYLASMYRRFISEGLLVIKVNDEELTFDAPGILEALPVRAGQGQNESVIWKKPVDIELGGDKRITGWVGLKDKASQINTGFALFRRGRLIQGGPDDPYSPETICSSKNKIQFLRLFGELDVHGFGVTHTKDAINWDGLEEDFVAKLKLALQEGEHDFIYQATYFRVDKPNPKAMEALTSQVAIPITQMAELFDDVARSMDEFASIPIPDELENTLTASDSRDFVHTMEDGSTWSAQVNITDNERGKLLSVSSSAGESNSGINGRVEIHISSAHPFFRAFADPDLQNLEPLMQFLGVLSIAIGHSKFSGGKHQALLDSINKVALRWSDVT